MNDIDWDGQRSTWRTCDLIIMLPRMQLWGWYFTVLYSNTKKRKAGTIHFWLLSYRCDYVAAASMAPIYFDVYTVCSKRLRGQRSSMHCTLVHINELCTRLLSSNHEWLFLRLPQTNRKTTANIAALRTKVCSRYIYMNGPRGYPDCCNLSIRLHSSQQSSQRQRMKEITIRPIIYERPWTSWKKRTKLEGDGVQRKVSWGEDLISASCGLVNRTMEPTTLDRCCGSERHVCGRWCVRTLLPYGFAFSNHWILSLLLRSFRLDFDQSEEQREKPQNGHGSRQ